MALRASGLAEGGEDGEALLREAVDVLATSEARVELIRARVDLGAHLRRANRRAEAREHLRSALDAAHGAGAGALARRAEVELRATGARPRSLVLSGPDSLTASERRVAQLARDGMTNREIAQTLFVTARTVEGHLTQVFRKLESSTPATGSPRRSPRPTRPDPPGGAAKVGGSPRCGADKPAGMLGHIEAPVMKGHHDEQDDHHPVRRADAPHGLRPAPSTLGARPRAPGPLSGARARRVNAASPGSRPTSDARVSAVGPKRSRTASSAASSAAPGGLLVDRQRPAAARVLAVEARDGDRR